MSSMPVVIDGKAAAARVRGEVKAEVERFVHEHGRAPGLSVVLVGDDPASEVYVRNKEKAASEVGMRGEVRRLPKTASEAEVLGVVRELNADPAVDGILVQFPVPEGVSQRAILLTIAAAKDVDGLVASNVGRLWSGEEGLFPCTPSGCIRLLEDAGVGIAGKRAVVIGRSNLVGKPIAALLLERSATVTIAHSRTVDLPALCREADILVAAVGRAHFVKGDWIKPGAAVIDVGINRTESGKLAGDVDYQAALARAGYITPVPGGVGPMTIAMLLGNTVRAAFARESARG